MKGKENSGCTRAYSAALSYNDASLWPSRRVSRQRSQVVARSINHLHSVFSRFDGVDGVRSNEWQLLSTFQPPTEFLTELANSH